jgi:N-acyl amino acid synthase of PEP-CTERM/exosortase system
VNQSLIRIRLTHPSWQGITLPIALLFMLNHKSIAKMIEMSIVSANVAPQNPVDLNASTIPTLTPIEASALYFRERILEDPADFTQSFELRYEVYCREMEFLPASEYPAGIETDVYDHGSLHFGSFNTDNDIVGTVRLVRGKGLHELPMDEHCDLYPGQRKRLEAITDIVEVSRLAVSRQYRRRAGDGQYGLSGLPASGGEAPSPFERRRVAYPTVLRLYRVMYHSLKREGISHIVASMETTLYRVLRALRFPFSEIGPISDYYGPVRPFYLNLSELEISLKSNRPEILHYFNHGLASKFQSDLLR